MRPITTTVVGAANGSAIALDQNISPFQVVVAAGIASGVVSYKLQVTYDDVSVPIVNWFDSTDMVTEVAASQTVLTAPVTAVRIVNAGTGTVTARILQAG